MDTNLNQQFHNHPGVDRSHLRAGAGPIRFFGVGNSFPTGANPDLDASASVNIRLFSILTHTNGSQEETVHFDYGMQTLRAPIIGVFLTDPTDDALGHSRDLTSRTARSDFVCCL